MYSAFREYTLRRADAFNAIDFEADLMTANHWMNERLGQAARKQEVEELR